MADDDRDRTLKYIRNVSGVAAAGALMYLSLLSIRTEFTLDTHVIVGLLALVVILMYGPEALEGIIRAWRRMNGE